MEIYKAPQLKYFTAVWCVPCKTFGPIVEEVTNRLEVSIDKIDIDKRFSEVPDDVRSVPTVIAYRENKEVDRIVGSRSAQDFEGWVRSTGV